MGETVSVPVWAMIGIVVPAIGWLIWFVFHTLRSQLAELKKDVQSLKQIEQVFVHREAFNHAMNGVYGEIHKMNHALSTQLAAIQAELAAIRGNNLTDR